MLHAASHESLWRVGGLQSFIEQKGFKKGKQQVPMLQYIVDKQELQPNTEQYYHYPLKLPPKPGRAQQGNLHCAVIPQQTQA